MNNRQTKEAPKGVSIDSNEKVEQKPSGTYLTLPDDVHDIIGTSLRDEDLSQLASTNRKIYAFYKPQVEKRYIARFLQAVIDDDKTKVKKILDHDPDLLLKEPDSKLIVESQCTWQKFYAEHPLSMATKRKQMGMIQLLLTYLDKLELKDLAQNIKMDALAKWSQQENKSEMHIPHHYITFLQSIIHVLKMEEFPNGVDVTAKLSEVTEAALHLFREEIHPQSPISLDNYMDIELLIYTACQLHRLHLHDPHQQNFFCIRVIGFLQRLLPPETVKFFYLQRDYSKFEQKVLSAKLLENKSFYASSRNSLTGLGFNYFCVWGAAQVSAERSGFSALEGYMRKFYLAKENHFQEIMHKIRLGVEAKLNPKI